MAQITEALIQNAAQTRHIAKIGLNGYKSFTQSPTSQLGTSRLIWSFTILEGNRKELKRSWLNNQPVTLKTSQGKTAHVRVAAYPIDDQSFGLLEFL
jgi:hypothetical protein